MDQPGTKPPLDSHKLGQLAYEAYCKSSGGRSLISGAELPQYVALCPRIQLAWVEAAVAVASEVMDHTIARLQAKIGI